MKRRVSVREGASIDTFERVAYESVPVELLVKLLLKLFVEWLNAHPHSAFARFMLKPRGPRTDVRAMNRLQRLSSSRVFLLWGLLFLGLWLLIAYVTFGLGLFPPDQVVIQVLIFGLALLSGVGLIGGIYLLFRVLL